MKKCIVVILLSIFTVFTSQGYSESLISWKDGSSKSAIQGFVTSVTDSGSKDFVPAGDRIGVFDNDGTLWTEKPVYFQLYFAFDRGSGNLQQIIRSGRASSLSRISWRETSKGLLLQERKV